MSLETWYRTCLLAYPAAVREEHGEELLGTLLAVAEHQGRAARLAEGASLLRCGLALRARRRGGVRLAAPVAGLGGGALVCLLAVLGVQQLVVSAVLATGLDGYPDRWGLGALWVDPRWPVQVAWVVTAAAYLLRRTVLTVAAGWGAAALGGWMAVAAATSGAVPWPGSVGPHWVLGPGVTLPLVLGVVAVLLLGGPGRVATARAAVPTHWWRSALLVGVVATFAAQAAAAATYAALGDAAIALAEDLRHGLLPVLLSGSVLGLGLLRTPGGRGAVAVLVLLAAAPLALSRPVEGATVAVAAALLGLGYVAGSVRRTLAPSG